MLRLLIYLCLPIHLAGNHLDLHYRPISKVSGRKMCNNGGWAINPQEAQWLTRR